MSSKKRQSDFFHLSEKYNILYFMNKMIICYRKLNDNFNLFNLTTKISMKVNFCLTEKIVVIQSFS